MQRHEVDGRCGWSWTSLLSRNKAMLTAQEASTLRCRSALDKDDDPYLLRVPLIIDLTTDPAQHAALKLIVSRQSIARPFAAPPASRRSGLAALRSRSTPR